MTMRGLLLLVSIFGTLSLLNCVSGATLTIPVKEIFPNNNQMVEQVNIFLNKTTDQSKLIIAKELEDLKIPVKAFVLQNLVKASKHAFNDPHATFEVELPTLKELIKKYEEYKPTEKPPVDIEKIYPDNLDQQDKVRDFLDQLSKDSQDLVGLYLGNRTSEQQGRVLLDLSKNVDPTQNNVTLDADTIKEAIERDERRNIEGTMEVTKFIPGTISIPATIAPPTTVSTSTIAGTESPSPHRLENIFPTKPELQKRLEKFWYNLTPASQTTLRNSICNLKPEKQRRILVYLARVSEAKTDQTGDKMKLDSDTMEKVVSMDDEGQMGESQKIIDDGKWPDHPLNEDSSAIDFKTEAPSSGGGIVQQAACLSLVTVVLLAV
ncbi:hypothetical protein RI129_012549 [Pyrocoelia pectoralis]|uniref:Uncharacterized protein n=1 Tax=Pyrocoelia pectoralis TaxID=417401 RepID=A0AAN7V7G6_9COLE